MSVRRQRTSWKRIVVASILRFAVVAMCAPIAVSEASVQKSSGAPSNEWAKSAASESCRLHSVNAYSASGVHVIGRLSRLLLQ